MRMTYVATAVVVLLLSTDFIDAKRYLPKWESLDTRPLPQWYDDAKFGIFIVWGIYSVPGYGNEWFWHNWKDGVPAVVEFMKENYPPSFTYGDFAANFGAEMFNPDHWVDVLKASGARYVVLTAKFHDGYTLWPSAYSFNWNSLDVGPKRDLVGSLAAAVRNKTDIHVGLYHSLFEWYNPLYLEDKRNAYKTQKFVKQKAVPSLHELIANYRPDVLWSDGAWQEPDTYWNSTEFLAWLYNDSPVKDTIVVNDRWGIGVQCHHGDFYTCTDRFNPGVLQKHKWEDCMTIDRASWGFRRNVVLADYLNIEQLITQLAQTVSCGGNLLMDIGPTHDGRIIPIFEERLRQMGKWLAVNGEAIYASKPWTYQNDTINNNVWYTCQKTASMVVVYAIVLQWPQDDLLYLGAPTTTTTTSVSMLGYSGPGVFHWTPGTGGKGVYIQFPRISIRDLPSTWAWVLKLEHIA